MQGYSWRRVDVFGADCYAGCRKAKTNDKNGSLKEMGWLLLKDWNSGEDWIGDLRRFDYKGDHNDSEHWKKVHEGKRGAEMTFLKQFSLKKALLLTLIYNILFLSYICLNKITLMFKLNRR